MRLPRPDDVLAFWFSDDVRPRWFDSNAAFDRELEERFGAGVAAALDGTLSDWEGDCDTALALVLLLDQATRNIFRGQPASFGGDAQALRISKASIDRGCDAGLTLERRMFLYMPLQHSESLADQKYSIELFTRWADEHDESGRANAKETLLYAQRHHDIIERFGRFPHRNAVLGRTSTAGELEFLAGPNSSF
jgi:uncharacterized protein (DUF924 family)